MNNITDHARKRIKKRVGKADPEKLLGEALMSGYKHNQFTGSFRKYLDRLSITHKSTPIIHKGQILFIAGSRLITLYPIPSKYKNHKPKS